MLPHTLTNIEIQKYYQNKSKFNGVYLRNNLPKIKDGTYVINLDECNKSVGNHWIALYVSVDNATYFDSFDRVEKKRNKGQCTTGPTATTVQSSEQLIVKFHAKNQKILERGSEYNFEKVHFEPKFDLLIPIGPGQEFSGRHHIHNRKCLISV